MTIGDAPEHGRRPATASCRLGSKEEAQRVQGLVNDTSRAVMSAVFVGRGSRRGGFSEEVEVVKAVGKARRE